MPRGLSPRWLWEILSSQQHQSTSHRISTKEIFCSENTWGTRFSKFYSELRKKGAEERQSPGSCPHIQLFTSGDPTLLWNSRAAFICHLILWVSLCSFWSLCLSLLQARMTAKETVVWQSLETTSLVFTGVVSASLLSSFSEVLQVSAFLINTLFVISDSGCLWQQCLLKHTVRHAFSF